MWNGKTLLMLAVLGLAGLSFLPPAQGDEHGRLTIATPDPGPSPSPSSPPVEVNLGVVDVSGAKGPSCTPKFIGAADLAVLAAIGVQTPEALGVRMEVLEKPLMLHKLMVHLYSNNQVVWESEPECTGCLQTYNVSDPNQGGGPVFRLDATALALAMQQWPQATALGLSGRAHDGATARFSFVRLGPGPPKKGK
jgi:hypothetical protein